jgi:hypothetical protein
VFLMVFLVPINQEHRTYNCTFHSVKATVRMGICVLQRTATQCTAININSSAALNKGTAILLQQCYLLTAVNVRYIVLSYKIQTSHHFSDPYHHNYYLLLSHQQQSLFNYMWQVIFPTNTSDLNARHVLTSPNTTQNNVVFL